MKNLGLVEEVNEKFLEAILDSENPTALDILTSAYLNFAHAAEVMQDVILGDEDEWDEDELDEEDL